MRNAFFLFVFSCLLINYTASAQELTRPFFLKLQTGEIIEADKIQLKSPIFKSNHFLVNDSLKFNPAIVSAFQNEDGYYARIDPGNSYESFAKRLLDGPRIDRFATTRDFYDYSYGGGYSPYGYGYGMPRVNRRKISFFSKDEGPLYEVNYQNLLYALEDNEASLALLHKYRKEKFLNTGVTVLGTGLVILGSYLSLNNAPNQQTGVSQISPVLYAGAGVLGAQFVFNLFQKDKLLQAMEVYNYQTR